MPTDPDAVRRRILRAARDGKLTKDVYGGYMIDRYPRVDLDVTTDARAAAADGLIATLPLPPRPGATGRAELTDAGRAWLEAPRADT